jgi:hypothetical protein
VKIESRGTEVEIFGAETEEQVFSIATTAIAFETLSARLYSDRVTAIIRELSCNAYDAHVEAGCKKKPFELNLPTPLNPEFIIRDFGNGMDDAQIMSLYCTYFASSKQGTNKQIGGFGIGSKSPFSYTDGFTVISRQKGEKRIYSAYINENKVPAVVRLSTESTTEVDGLEVRFPVAVKDAREFENKAKTALEFFDPLPTVNRPQFQVRKHEYDLEGSNWKVRKCPDTGEGNVRIIQGMVPYELKGLEGVELTAAEQNVLTMPIDIFLPIGTLSPAATRETLTNDKHTLAKTKKVLAAVYEDLVNKVEEQLKLYTTGWEKLSFLRKLRTHKGFEMATINKEQELLADTNLFGEKVIKQVDFPKLVVRQYYKDWGSVKSSEIFGKNGQDNYNLTGTNGPFSWQDLRFVVIDKNFGGDQEIRRYLNASEDYGRRMGRMIVIFPMFPNAKVDQFDSVGYYAEVEKFHAALGKPKLEKLSELPIPALVRSAGKGVGERGEMYRSWIWRCGQNFSESWKPLTAPRPKDGICYYVKTTRGKIQGLNDYCSPLVVDELFAYLQLLPFVDFKVTDELHAFSEYESMPVRTNAKWIDLIEHAKSKLTEYLSNPANGPFTYSDCHWELGETAFLSRAVGHSEFRQLPPESLYQRALTLLKRRDGEVDFERLTRLFMILEKPTAIIELLKSIFTKDDSIIKWMRAQVKAKYPLLNSRDQFNKSLILFYINQMDSQPETVPETEMRTQNGNDQNEENNHLEGDKIEVDFEWNINAVGEEAEGSTETEVGG